MIDLKKILDKFGIDILKSSNSFSNEESLGLIKKYSEFPNIGIMDTSVSSYNLGDFIIMEAVYKALNETFDYNAYFTTFPTHLHISGNDRIKIAEKELLFIGGTNLLNFENIRAQWKIRPTDIKYYYKRCVLLGVGSSKYTNSPSETSISYLKDLLSDTHLHSVRDEHTKIMLNKVGINNVINTCCPTTWHLINNKIDWNKKNNKVVTTITDYSEDIENDSKMLKILLEKYSSVHLWVQSIKDILYLKKLINLDSYENLHLIPPSLEAYRIFLENNHSDLDYIGTRLHAGIYAMQRNIRSLIIAIDNRATEISNDIKLNIVNRTEVDNIKQFIDGSIYADINIPEDKISLWKSQFKK